MRLAQYNNLKFPTPQNRELIENFSQKFLQLHDDKLSLQFTLVLLLARNLWRCKIRLPYMECSAE